MQEDQYMKRGCPLYLNEERWKEIEAQWLNGSVEYDSGFNHACRLTNFSL